MRRPERVLVALVATLCTLSLVSVGYLGATRLARKKVNEKVAQLSKRLGAPIEVGRVGLGLFAARLDDVRVGDEASIVASRVTVEVGLNPFDGSFGKPKAVVVHKARLKAGADRIEGQLDQLTGDAPEGEAAAVRARRSLERLFQALPTERLWVKSAGLTVVDASGEPMVQLRGLQLLVDRRESKLLFKLGGIRNKSGLAESNLQGRLQLDPKTGHYRYFVRKKRGENAKANDWSIAGRVWKDLNELDVTVDVRRVPGFLAAPLQPLLGAKPLLTLKGDLKAKRDEAGLWRFTARAGSTGTRLEVPLLSASPIGPVRFDAETTGFWRADDRILALEQATLTVPPRGGPRDGRDPLRFTLTGAGRVDDFHWRGLSSPGEIPVGGISWQGQARLVDASCQSLLDAAPPGLTPSLEGFKVSGQVGLAMSLRFDGDKPDSLVFDLTDARWSCRVTEAPYTFTAEHLSGPFSLQRPAGKTEDGRELEPVEVSVSPLSPGFTPLTHIARTVNQAFVASEDAGFYTHKGIDGFALENAARKNFAEKRVAVGGSTITMQTVKNLFLSHERTVSRKLQELFLAWHLENVLEKDRILEIYLNIVEFGPGIYGITTAAEHFFGKMPSDLTLVESAYLASLLPNPKARYRSFCAGRMTPGMKDLVSGLLKRMAGLGRISWDRYAQALGAGVTFNDVERQSALGCVRRGVTDGDAS